jgi:hypothetical protein
MDIKQLTKSFPIIKRAKHLSCGLIAEVKQPAQMGEDWQKAMYNEIAENVWNSDREIIYAMYFYKNNDDLFVLDGILRTRQSDQAFTMSTSYLGTEDVFGQFARFDFDCLTLSDRDDLELVPFRVAPGSPATIPRAVFRELDLQGFQFLVSTAAQVVDAAQSIYTISVAAKPGGDFP